MKTDKKKLIGGIIALSGFAMMLFGMADEQHRDVFEKAVRICLECIGIG